MTQEIENTLSNLDKLIEDKVGFMSFNRAYAAANERYTVILKKESEDINMEVKTRAYTLIDAIEQAVDKWTRIVNGGISEFKGTLIEGPKIDQFGDEIPF